jgi:uncharacterized protein (TIGR02118 family)
MILRSGLIENRKGVDEADFARHWRDVHGRIAARLPGLAGYVQNHIVTRAPVTRPSGMHRVDGVSQLWFKDLDAMRAAMDSPAQEACVKDISGFLERVTLAVQIPGEWEGGGAGARGAKAIAIYVGRDGVAELSGALNDARARGDFAPTRFRLNRMAEGDFIVDPRVAHDRAPLLAVLEAEFANDAARDRALASGALDPVKGPAAAAILAVEPIVFIAPPG